MKDNWSGKVALQSGEIGEDFAYYFTVSEQTPSAVSLGVLVNPDHQVQAAGGLLIQMMPDATEEDIVKTEALLKTLPPMSTLINEKESLREIVSSLYDDVEILEEMPVEFRCHCSKATIKRMITTLPKEERLAMIHEDHGCEVTCHFCNSTYQLSEAELRELEDFLERYEK